MTLIVKNATHGYVHSSTGITGFTSLFENQGSLYVLGSDFAEKSGKGIYMLQFNDNLAAVDTIGLLTTVAGKNNESTFDAVEADGNVVFAAWVTEKNDISFVADNKKKVYTTTNSRILASITLKKETPTAVENVDVKATKAQKVIRDGQVLIIRDGQIFNALGAQVQ